jgi:hypothetical protein
MAFPGATTSGVGRTLVYEEFTNVIITGQPRAVL